MGIGQALISKEGALVWQGQSNAPVKAAEPGKEECEYTIDVAENEADYRRVVQSDSDIIR